MQCTAELTFGNEDFDVDVKTCLVTVQALSWGGKTLCGICCVAQEASFWFARQKSSNYANDHV